MQKTTHLQHLRHRHLCCQQLSSKKCPQLIVAAVDRAQEADQMPWLKRSIAGHKLILGLPCQIPQISRHPISPAEPRVQMHHERCNVLRGQVDKTPSQLSRAPEHGLGAWLVGCPCDATQQLHFTPDALLVSSHSLLQRCIQMWQVLLWGHVPNAQKLMCILHGAVLHARGNQRPDLIRLSSEAHVPEVVVGAGEQGAGQTLHTILPIAKHAVSQQLPGLMASALASPQLELLPLRHAHWRRAGDDLIACLSQARHKVGGIKARRLLSMLCKCL
mmetsp:Transcript_110329/g.285173  ORF Transcript_110329/g.285173 Transcript_110329/m.285173 type:complete len:274 (-) Transcript_110329:119-940(-)